MERNEVKINWNVLENTAGNAMLTLARKKAAEANSTIVYQEGNVLIEENPLTGTKKEFQYHHTGA